VATARDTINRITNSFHNAIYKVSGGAIAGKFGDASICLLTTTGRKSGKPRTHPLNYWPDGDHIILVASNAGQSHHPAWYLNLTADPKVTLQRGNDTTAMVARTATPEEKAQLWPRIVEWWKGYAGHQAKTTRDIPVVILEPAPDRAS
jgi:F420H(2)-dependent quinone reductase